MRAVRTLNRPITLGSMPIDPIQGLPMHFVRRASQARRREPSRLLIHLKTSQMHARFLWVVADVDLLMHRLMHRLDVHLVAPQAWVVDLVNSMSQG